VFESFITHFLEEKMASDGEPSDTALSEAIAESRTAVASAFAGDLEARYMALKKEKDSLEETKQTQEEKIAGLQASLLQRDAELAATKRDKNTLQENSTNHAAEGKARQERMSRMEAEADSLREEIRYEYQFSFY
jgi:chromosome segregation ATPase